MQQMFSCRKCGTQNAVGQSSCRVCGERFIYRCSNCNGVVSLPARFCANCGLQLSLPNSQGARSAPIRQTNYPRFQDAYRFNTGAIKPRDTSSALLGFIGLIIGLAVIVSGVMFATNTDLLVQSSPPPAVSPKVDNTPAQVTTPSSEPDDSNIVYYDVPDYVQQFTIAEARFAKASGEAVYLINNPDAKDISFDELKDFIIQDATDEEDYIEGVRMCVDFAETLHNNAEQAGIKAAVVGIKFRNEAVGHAINAFITTDRGLVYVDCTGEGIKPVTVNEWIEEPTYNVEQDKIAYIEQGEKYGVISIDKINSLDYDFYVEYVQDWQKCTDMVKDYNEEVERYNSEVEGKVFYEGSPELAEIQAWKAELIQKETQIKELAEKLGNYLFEPLGIVETVALYW